MDDIISRREAIDALAKFVLYAIYDESTESYTNGLTDAYNLICQLPSAQPERKKGKWIYCPKASGSVTSTAVHLYPVCSECGCEHPATNYCPNCGARMEEGEAENEAV